MTTQNDVDVLLVEDNPRDAELTFCVLRKHHLADRLVHVLDGEEALEWLFGTGRYTGRDPRRGPRVVLLDLKLPKISGLEVLAAIRDDERTRLLPVVALSSSREERDVIDSYTLGVSSYVVKPVDFESFSTAVAQVGHYWLIVNQGVR